MEDLHLSKSIFFSILPFFFIFIFFFKSIFSIFFIKPTNNFAPRSYPLIGSLFFILQNNHRFIQWTSDYVNNSPTKTAVLHRPLGRLRVLTANPAVVRHILKTNFHLYPKGKTATNNLFDLLGHGIFNIDGDGWKFQRQVSSHEFNTKSLRNFVEHVVDTELNDRLLPIFATSAATGGSETTVLDLQDILQRFTFDNICKIAFGHDPAYLLPSLPDAIFATAFEEAVMISTGRLRSNLPLLWKLKRILDIGSEKRLRIAVGVVREFAIKITKEKKQELKQKSSIDSVDLLSRFLTSGHSDENFVADIVISFILAGRDTTSAVLTWFFWLIYKNPRIESEILKEIKEKPESLIYDEVKDMVYTHASLCETMRLYPPVAVDGKEAADDDVLPDGTVMKKGYPISYHIYAMGRSEELWGSDWSEFRPERWLEKDISGKWVFKPRDVYEYPVFQAGPRVCLGKEMAFLQMKRVVAGVLRRFRVVPATDDGVDPVYVVYFTAKMKGGFPVRIENRDEIK
ncbi:cytochrome P450 94A2-like [Cynara cardunculus var. scolymus]|uniref:Cytochrome P450 n=1 Tax=Cynara cardunculus var. scolymus TaxID=59895 RepID=A0A103YNI2_CYNCS|nr:cytochrome P450 94A2-like [Cynara cardunculus var. scolymus]KVI12386.1 cytochrome P450 [Cynara cardunculus var. scolymus]